MALPTVTFSAAYSTITITYATDVAGIITVTALNSAFVPGTITVTFGYTFAVAPIVVFSYADANGAAAFNTNYVTSTTTTFVIHTSSTSLMTMYYHVFETQ